MDDIDINDLEAEHADLDAQIEALREMKRAVVEQIREIARAEHAERMAKIATTGDSSVSIVFGRK